MFIPFLVYVRHFLDHTIVFLVPVWPSALGSHLVLLMVAPVSSEISDFTPCTHAQSNILHTKYVEKLIIRA